MLGDFWESNLWDPLGSPGIFVSGDLQASRGISGSHFPGCISVLFRTDDEEPTTKKFGTGEDGVFMTQHTQVVGVGVKVPKAFVLKLSANWNKRAISTWQVAKWICWWGRLPQTNKVPT